MTADQKQKVQTIINVGVDEGLPLVLSQLMADQALHESGSFTSNVFKKCNNLNGYKHIGQELSTGPCTPSPEGDFYAGYKNIDDSAREMARWIKRRWDDFENVTTPEEYAETLKKNGYFTDGLDNYTNAMTKFWSSVKGMANTAITKYPEASIITGFTFFGLLTYYVIAIARRKK